MNPARWWGFKGLGGEGGGRRSGVLSGVNLLSGVSPGPADLMVRAAGCWWWENCLVRPCFLPLDLAHRQVSSICCQPPISLFLVSVFT